jgi:hypothetical protein
MVEEGELKKRIKALAEPDEEIFPYSSLEYRIDEIIDEAKKALDLAKTYEELKSTIKRWFGE